MAEGVASRMPDLRKRVGTALGGGAALVALVAWGRDPGIYLLTAVLVIAMLFEFAGIVFRGGDRVEKRWLMLILGWLVLLLDFTRVASEITILITTFLCIYSYFLITARKHDQAQLSQHFGELLGAWFGFVYVAFLPLFLPRLHGLPGGVAWTFAFLFIVWAGDTAAYFVGIKWGKTKLYPLISPKKSCEGAIAGLAAGCLVAVICAKAGMIPLNIFSALFLGTIVGIAAIIGDLAESFFKRAFDTKDSGSILPGHGGFLDRFDGVVFAAPVMYACVRILG